MRYVLLFLIAALSSTCFAAEDNYEFDDPAQQQMFLSLTEELRCPMCQNQNIADSDAMIAHDLRRKVYQLIQQGYTRDEVVIYMKERYGDFVSYSPPVTPVTMWLWLLPVVVIMGGVFVVLRRRKSGPVVFDKQRLEEADALLEKEE